MEQGLAEANSSGKLYFFKLQFMKYVECMHFKHKRIDCNNKFGGHHASQIGNIQQWRPHWI